ncbi:MAG TPA: family 1 glycosylhydrolase, partial [Aggregatilineales bacterium]|nr:family 1 glycosylhydrolase [Aggregatilineales bacterium]
ATIGIVLNYTQAEAYNDTPADMQAARYQDGYINRWFLDPVFRGEYPADMVELYGDRMQGIDTSEVSAAAVPVDFLGLNYYTRNCMTAAPNNPILPVAEVTPAYMDYTTMNWQVYPEGIRKMLMRVHRDYHPSAIYVTENGSAWDDPKPVNGLVDDPNRVAYLSSHLKAIEAAIDSGVPLKGYFAWSLMDNFEWAFGYSQRFGIIHVDYETQKRTWKQTARYYKNVIAANAVVEKG